MFSLATTHKTPPSLVILISGNGSNLQAIIDRIQTKQLHANIAAVMSNHTQAYGLKRAQEAGIPAKVLLASDYGSRQAYDDALQQEILKLSPDLLVLAGFMRVLSPTFVDAFAGRIINIHPSLLPKFKGLNTHQKVLACHELHHGCSVHQVTAELDDGPILSQAQLNVQPDDTVDTLQQRVHQLEHQLLPLTIAGLLAHQTYCFSHQRWIHLEPKQTFQLKLLTDSELNHLYHQWEPYGRP